MFSSAYLRAEWQVIQMVHTADTLPIDEPTFTPEQHPELQITKPRLGMCEITNAQLQCRLIFRTAVSVPRGSTELR